MKRRDFVLSLGALLAAPQLSLASSVVTRPNGEWDGEVFHWRKIAVDPFGIPGKKKPFSVVLDLFGIPLEYRAVITRKIEISTGVYTTPDEPGDIAEGHRYLAMVSGGILSARPWVARNVAPHPDGSWKSTKVDVWRVSIGKTRYVFARPWACDNWLLLEVRNGTYQCRCVPELGDTC